MPNIVLKWLNDLGTMSTRPSEDFCCDECFDHAWLRALARENKGHAGRCFYCGNCAALTAVPLFRNGLGNLLKDYIPAFAANGGGDPYLPSVPVIEAIQRDWKLFSTRCSPERLQRFLPAVFKGDPESHGRDFGVPVVPFHRNAMSTAFDRWREFWLIDPKDSSDWLGRDAATDIDVVGTYVNQKAQHLRYFVRSLPARQRLWRARSEYVGSSDWDCEPLPLSQMGHNPQCPASRLNLEGDVVLYSAESEKTAVAEIRPGKGFICTTCELTTTRALEILDLASPLTEINPFTTEHLSWQLDLQRVARNISAHIAKPISRGEDPGVYNKAQYLAMIVRAMKLDGVRFSSSLDAPNGVNVALFDPTVVEYSNARIVVVTSTEIAYESIQPQRLAPGSKP